MSPPAPVSKVDTKGATKEMLYIRKTEDRKGYVFRMKTPPALIGTIDPKTGKPFGKEIVRGLGTRHFPTAKKKRDRILGSVRDLEIKAEAVGESYAQWTISAALERREAILDQQSRGADQPSYDEREGELHFGEEDLAALTVDEITNELDRPASRRSAPQEVIRKFASVALRGDLPISEAVGRYQVARSPENQRFKPLAKTTVVALSHSVEYLKAHIGGDVGIQSVSKDQIHAFRTEFLPKLKPPRSPNGLSQKTIDKHITLLRGLWAWAGEAMLLDSEAPDIWAEQRRVPRARAQAKEVKDFTADQVSMLLLASPQGTHKGDTIRLLLVTGCRANDIASLTVATCGRDTPGLMWKVERLRAQGASFP